MERAHAKPNPIPTNAAVKKPIKVREALDNVCVRSVPLSNSSTNEANTASGAGNRMAGMDPVLLTAYHKQNNSRGTAIRLKTHNIVKNSLLI